MVQETHERRRRQRGGRSPLHGRDDGDDYGQAPAQNPVNTHIGHHGRHLEASAGRSP